jgi:hypothetical protein
MRSILAASLAIAVAALGASLRAQSVGQMIQTGAKVANDFQISDAQEQQNRRRRVGEAA